MFRSVLLLCLLACPLLAAPPEVPAGPPLRLKVGEERQVVIKLEKGKKGVFAPGFRDSDCTLFRGHSDDDQEMVFLVKPKAVGYYRVAFLTVGEGKFSYLDIDATGGAVVPVIPPIVDPPVKPPADAAYYFLIVRPDGPADPAFTKVMGLPGWAELKKKGHQYKPKTAAEAKLDLNFDATGLTLPAVVTLSIADGKSKIVGDPVPLPTTDAGILKLLEGK